MKEQKKINRKSCRNQQIKQKKPTSIPRDSLIKVKTHFTLGVKNGVEIIDSRATRAKI